MKFLVCIPCSEFVQMQSERINSCTCGNVAGKYLEDGFTVSAKVRERKKARLMGLSNQWIQDAVHNNHLFYPLYMSVLTAKHAAKNNPEVLARAIFKKMEKGETLFERRFSPVIMVPVFTTYDIIRMEDE